MHKHAGFTLIELMVVISIIGILAAIAIPQFTKYRDRAIESEGIQLAGAYRKEVVDYYDAMGSFPENNDALGLPAPDTIYGKYVKSLTISDGEVTVRFNEKMSGENADKIFRLVPHINPDYTTGPISWEWIRPPQENRDE